MIEPLRTKSILLAIIVIALSDSCCVYLASEGSQYGLGHMLLGAIYLLPLYMLISSPLLLAHKFAVRFLESQFSQLFPAFRIASLAVPLFSIITYLTVLWSNGFNNHELSALLVTIIVMIAGFSSIFISWIFFRNFNQRKTWKTNVLAGALNFSSIGYLIVQNTKGFEQLDSGTFAVPIAGLITLVVAISMSRKYQTFLGPNHSRKISWITFVVGITTFLGVEMTGNSVASEISVSAPWGQRLASLVRTVTDFDQDGHSSLMGGEDCAPFDGQINPGATDVPGDGIDNNCVGGDLIKLADKLENRWHALPPDWPKDMNFIMITIDTIRADHVGFLGYPKPTTPNMDILARKSIVFERFYANSTYTRLSLPTLFSSLLPSQIKWIKQKSRKVPRIDNETPWLSKVFQTAGIKTAAFVPAIPLFTPSENMGFDRGFDEYHIAKQKYKGGTLHGFPMKKQIPKVIRWLKKNRNHQFFMWLHLAEPHYLYETPKGSPDFGSTPQDKYDSEIWGVDHELAKVFKILEKLDLQKKTMIFISGDHGEEFGEHGKRWHGSNLFEPQVHTMGLLHVPPLSSKLPQRDGKIKTPYSFTNIPSTIVNLMGLPDALQSFNGGQNLTGSLFSSKFVESPIILELWSIRNLTKYQTALIQWPHKLIMSGKRFKKKSLFNLVNDPKEKINLIQFKKNIFESMSQTIFDYQNQISRKYHQEITELPK
jgi:hypothetical protein